MSEDIRWPLDGQMIPVRDEDVAALRAEVTSLRARQEMLADALAAAGEEVAKLQGYRDAIDRALALLTAIDYEEGSRIDRAILELESA